MYPPVTQFETPQGPMAWLSQITGRGRTGRRVAWVHGCARRVPRREALVLRVLCRLLDAPRVGWLNDRKGLPP